MECSPTCSMMAYHEGRAVSPVVLSDLWWNSLSCTPTDCAMKALLPTAAQLTLQVQAWIHIMHCSINRYQGDLVVDICMCSIVHLLHKLC